MINEIFKIKEKERKLKLFNFNAKINLPSICKKMGRNIGNLANNGLKPN
jgi:hypothetical protein